MSSGDTGSPARARVLASTVKALPPRPRVTAPQPCRRTLGSSGEPGASQPHVSEQPLRRKGCGEVSLHADGGDLCSVIDRKGAGRPAQILRPYSP